ncbi:MAG: SCO family protein [Magnetococcales bacterium]|nr:SCO family protein [Magnetococcales bacterium]
MREPPKKKFMSKMAIIVLIVGGAISIILQLAIPKPTAPVVPKELQGIVLPEVKTLQPSFNLTDHDNRPFNLSRLKNRWSFLFFGYTHCPDICPTVLGEAAELFEHLRLDKKIYDSSQLVFISVDPGRDTPESLKEYVAYFNKDFTGVTGEQEQIKKLSKQLAAVYMISPEKDEDGDYQVFHSSSLFLINPNGEFFAIFKPEDSSPDKIAKTFLKIHSTFGDNF